MQHRMTLLASFSPSGYETRSLSLAHQNYDAWPRITDDYEQNFFRCSRWPKTDPTRYLRHPPIQQAQMAIAMIANRSLRHLSETDPRWHGHIPRGRIPEGQRPRITRLHIFLHP